MPKNKEMPRMGLWKVHTPNLLKEILNNPGTGMLARPLQIFGNILYLVGERAAELHDPELDALMMRLTLYSVANPEDPEYDDKLINEYIYGDTLQSSANKKDNNETT